jgi:nicotinate-nucleotide pyrophosphorylase (carboxylating)
MDGLVELVRGALREDVGSGDATTLATVAEDARALALITQKAPGSIYGLQVAELVFAQLDPAARFERMVEEGSWLSLIHHLTLPTN